MTREYVNPATGETIIDPPVRPFPEVLREIGDGHLAQDLSEKLFDLLHKVQATGRQGALTLTLTVSSKGAGRVDVVDSVKVKAPEFDRPKTAFFIDKQGNASRRDPNQPEIPGVTNIRKDA
ncbi:hypothetical protein [Tessaracoccus palaemonis]|uniref:Uncharacterized protein n=1 Tax=Tessaracoccus palaemonis TaxID=2829499 RepID=A0ABX8SID2_9ACTN|nr:hypothetical protein [Tessaracoccus palaemonis]QXT62739.1 hypothetical protein KDB89_13550 [Tessaracoccus palaemonis]